MNFFNKGLVLAVLAACFVSSASAVKTKEELLAAIKKSSDVKPCLFFESYGLYPHAVVYHPMKNEVKDILFACDTKGVGLVKTAEDFANLIPAKLRTSDLLGQIFTEYKYKGFVVDKIVMKAITSNDYKKHFKAPFIVSEYQSGMSMKWVFGTAEQFQGFKEYFLKNIPTPAEQKPFLVLEIEKNPEALTDEDLTFLADYFNVADLSNPEDKALADKITTSIDTASQNAADYAKIQVAQSLRDLLTDDVDKDLYGFERKKLVRMAIKGIVILTAAGVPYLVARNVLKPLIKAFIADPAAINLRERFTFLNDFLVWYNDTLDAQNASNAKGYAKLNKPSEE